MPRGSKRRMSRKEQEREDKEAMHALWLHKKAHLQLVAVAVLASFVSLAMVAYASIPGSYIVETPPEFETPQAPVPSLALACPR